MTLCDTTWTQPQRRGLRRRGVVQHGDLLVKCDDMTSKLSHTVQRSLKTLTDGYRDLDRTTLHTLNQVLQQAA